MKKIASSLALLLLLASQVFSQINVKKLDAYIEKARRDWGVPGMAVAIIQGEEITLSKGYGVLQEGKSTPVDENTLFAIASNTKAFVSSSLADLVADGVVKWDDKVQKYLPYFQLYDPYTSTETTIRDLLCHRAGLGTFSGDVIWYKSNFTAEDVVRKARFVPQAYPYRAGYGYSNLMFITAGEVIQSATGKPWYQYVEDEFFKPLSMDRSITSVARLEDLGNFATPHKPIEGKSRPISWVNWDNMGAAGGIISSVKDMSQWIKLNLQNGLWQGDTLIHPMQQNILWTPHNNFVVSEKSKKDIPGRHFSSYGLGWGLYDYFGRMVVTHSGGYDGMYSRVMMMPDEKLGVVILTNSMSGITFPLAMKIVNDFIKEDRRDWSAEYLAKTSHDDRISQLKQARVNNTSPSIDEEDFTGTYRSDMLGEIKIVKNEDQLKLLFSNAPNLSATIMHWHYDTWQIHWDETHAWFDFGLLTVKTSNDLKVTELTLDVPNHDIFFDELTIIRQE